MVMWVFTYIDRNVNIDSIMLRPSPDIVVPFLRNVMAYDESILGELLEEAFWLCALDVEVEGVGEGAQ